MRIWTTLLFLGVGILAILAFVGACNSVQRSSAYEQELRMEENALARVRGEVTRLAEVRNEEQARLVSQTEQLVEEMNAKREEQTRMQASFDQTQTKHGDLQAQITELTNQEKQLKTSVDELSTRSSQLSGTIAAQEASVKQLQAEYDTLSSQVTALQAQRRELSSTATTLEKTKQDLASAQRALATAQANLTSAQSSYEAKTKELETLSEQVSVLTL